MQTNKRHSVATKQPASGSHSGRGPVVWPTALLLGTTMLLAIVGVPWYQLAVGFEWTHWLAFALFAATNGIAITAGYHRLWAHNAYKAHPIMRLLLALFGAAAFQNSILVWSSQHRRHHRHVDDNERDPYSAKKGLWFSHIGWMLHEYPNGADDFSNCKDLQRDKIVMWQHKHYYSIAIAMNVLPPLLFGFITGEYLAYFLTMGILRLVYSHHTTFFINSLAHYWGKRPYCGDNTARDNDVLALFTYGEGYHNYHHLFQNDYRNGVRWYQFDPTKWLIKTCSWLGLAKDLRVTPKFKIREAMVTRQLEVARDKLANPTFINTIKQRLGTIEYARWREALENQIESEHQQLSLLLNEWKDIHAKWMTAKRERLQSAKQNMQSSLDLHGLKLKLKELEYSMIQQYRRVSYVNVVLA